MEGDTNDEGVGILEEGILEDLKCYSHAQNATNILKRNFKYLTPARICPCKNLAYFPSNTTIPSFSDLCYCIY